MLSAGELRRIAARRRRQRKLMGRDIEVDFRREMTEFKRDGCPVRIAGGRSDKGRGSLRGWRKSGSDFWA